METNSQPPLDPLDAFDQALAAAQAGDEAGVSMALGQVLALAELDRMPGSAYDALVMAIESALPLLRHVTEQKLTARSDELRAVIAAADLKAMQAMAQSLEAEIVLAHRELGDIAELEQLPALQASLDRLLYLRAEVGRVGSHIEHRFGLEQGQIWLK